MSILNPRSTVLANNLTATPSTCGRYVYNESQGDTDPRWWTFALNAAYSIEYLQVTGEGFDNSSNDESSSWGPVALCG